MGEPLDDLGKSFARHLRAQGKAAHTLKVYDRSIISFSQWIMTNVSADTFVMIATTDDLTRANIVDWLADLAESKAAATVRTRYRGLFIFCRWLAAEDHLPANPMAGLPTPAVPETPVPLISDEQLAALIKACQGKTWYHARDLAVIRFLLDTGCRVGEVAGLTLDNLDLDNEIAFILGKGNRRRPVYFGVKTTAALDKWLRMRRQHRWAHLPSVFLGERGAFTDHGIRQVVKYRGELAGIPNLYPHKFRHTAAHDYLLHGGQEKNLKRAMGWTSDAMLERYGSSGADVRAREAARQLRRGDRV